MGIIGWILLGLAAGAVVKLMTPDRDQGGLLGTLALGMAGALIADFAATSLRLGVEVNDLSLRSVAFAVMGSLVLVFLFGAFARPRTM